MQHSIQKKIKIYLSKTYVYIIKSLPISLGTKLAIDHRIRFGFWPNLKNPNEFSEKQIWRMVFDKRDILSFTCDKQAMKDYVSKKIPTLNIPNTYWLGKDLNKIIKHTSQFDLDKGWVLKPNHGSGDYIIGKGIPIISKHKIKNWMTTYGSLRTSGFGGWAYSKARKLYILEELIGNGKSALFDYKFYIFSGKFAALQLITGRDSHKKRYFLNHKWEILHSVEDPLGIYLPPAPPNFKEMIEIAEILGSDFDFIRIDLYYDNGKIWFSELTPYPSTMRSSRSNELNKLFGELWILPKSHS